MHALEEIVRRNNEKAEELLGKQPVAPVVPPTPAERPVKSAIAAAAQWCLEEEARDGNEHGVLLSVEGEVLSRVDGTANETNWKREDEEGLLVRGNIIVHNHPDVCRTLSQADIYMAAFHGLEIHAVTKDGGDYWADLSSWNSFPFVLMLGGDEGYYKIKPKLDKLEAEVLDRGKAELLLNHLCLLYLKKQGLLDYRYRLGGKMQAAVDALKEVTNR